jgi:hypothetical protein
MYKYRKRQHDSNLVRLRRMITQERLRMSSVRRGSDAFTLRYDAFLPFRYTDERRSRNRFCAKLILKKHEGHFVVELMPCCLIQVYRRFGGTHRFHLQGQ